MRVVLPAPANPVIIVIGMRLPLGGVAIVEMLVASCKIIFFLCYLVSRPDFIFGRVILYLVLLF